MIQRALQRISVVGLAGVISGGVFVTIHVLTSQPQGRSKPVLAPLAIDFLRLPRDETIRTRQRLPSRPANHKNLPPPPPMPLMSPPSRLPDWSPLQSVVMAPTKFGLAVPMDGAGQARYRVLPDYPRHARARGIEGWVLLEFDISSAGRPQNLRVVDSDPKGVFESSALRAVRQWIYHPRSYTNIRQLIRFDITQ